MALNSLICAAIMTLLTHTHSQIQCRWLVDVGCCSVDVVRESDVWRGHVDGSRQWKLSSVDSEKCHIVVVVVRHKRCGSAATRDQTYKCSAATKHRREWHALRSVGGALYCSTTQHRCVVLFIGWFHRCIALMCASMHRTFNRWTE